jgi:hypothetical protein
MGVSPETQGWRGLCDDREEIIAPIKGGIFMLRTLLVHQLIV